jgi:hypothetical protein
VHVSLRDLESFALKRLPEEDTTSIAAHVAVCPECKRELELTVRFLEQLTRLNEQLRTLEATHSERRKERRFQTDGPATMRLLYPDSSESWGVRILEVSRKGMKLKGAQPVAVGTITQIRVKDNIVTAEVRYCVAAEGGFVLGVLIQDVFQIP